MYRRFDDDFETNNRWSTERDDFDFVHGDFNEKLEDRWEIDHEENDILDYYDDNDENEDDK